MHEAFSPLLRALRWLAPSAAAACLATLAAVLVEERGAPLELVASLGLLGMVLVPLLVLLSASARGVIASWRQLLTRTDGRALGPAFVGWLATIGLGTAVLMLGMYRATLLLSSVTAFRPLPVAVATSVIAVMLVVVLIALAPSIARLFTAIARRFDDWWCRGGRRSLLRPALVLSASAAVLGLAAIVALPVFIRPRLGPLDLSLAYAPLAALVTTVLLHLVWGRIPRRMAVGMGLVVTTVLAAVLALVLRVQQPALALDLWAQRPLTGAVIERLFDLGALREDLALEVPRSAELSTAHPDILLVTIDTVRADATPPYGGAAQMPALQRVAERGAVFRWAFAPSNVTRRSIPSMMLGLSPPRVRGRVAGWALRIDPRHVMLAERLRAAGYETAGFMCCRGFWGPSSNTGLDRGLDTLVVDGDSSKLVATARAWLEARDARGQGSPLFVWIHLIDPHKWSPTADPPGEPARSQFYQRSLTAADSLFAEPLRVFERRPPAQQPIVIVTSDHGEGLGEHGAIFHATDLYNSQLRVPLVISGPGIPARMLDETVSLTDLSPTIMELAGFAPPRNVDFDGRSIADLVMGKRAPREDGVAFAAMIKDRSNPGGTSAIVQGRWKLLQTPSGVELYDIHADPGEKQNLAAAQPQRVEELQLPLRRANAAGARSPFR